MPLGQKNVNFRPPDITPNLSFTNAENRGRVASGCSWLLCPSPYTVADQSAALNGDSEKMLYSQVAETVTASAEGLMKDAKQG